MPSYLKDLKTGIGRIELELDEREAAAIGRVTANWAYLEHIVYSVTVGISEAVEVDQPEDTLNLSFTRRLGAMRLLAETYAPEKERSRMQRLVGQIANVEQDRHKMTHGLWDWDPANPERLLASSFRPRVAFEKKFDFGSLIKLGDRIAQISFELRFPDGWQDVWEERLGEPNEKEEVAYFAISRQMARMMVSKPTGDGGKS